MASSSGLFHSLHAELDPPPINSNLLVHRIVRKAMTLEAKEGEIKLKIKAAEDSNASIEEKIKIRSRDFIIFRNKMVEVNVEATGGTIDRLDSARIEGKREALYPLYQSAVDEVAQLKVLLHEGEKEISDLNSSLAKVQAAFGGRLDRINFLITTYGPVTSDDPEVAVFLCHFTGSPVMVPLFWSLFDEIQAVVDRRGLVLEFG